MIFNNIRLRDGREYFNRHEYKIWGAQSPTVKIYVISIVKSGRIEFDELIIENITEK